MGVLAAAAIPFSRLSAQTAPSPLKPGHFKWRPERAPSGPVVLIVSISEQLAYVYRNGIRIGVATCSTGAPGHRTPTGVFTILQKNADHYSNLYNNAPMPYMHRLTWRGIALHAGDLPGYPASHGCIRLPYEFAQRLFEITKLGTTVIISDKGSAPQEVNNPGLLIPDYAQQKAERVVEAETRNSRKSGWVTKVHEDVRSIVISGADRKAIVILNGKVEAEGAVRVLDTGQALGTHAFSLLGPNADRRSLRWMSFGVGGVEGQGSVVTRDTSDALRRIQMVNQQEALRLAMTYRPGTTLVVTELPASADTPRARTSSSRRARLTVCRGESAKPRHRKALTGASLTRPQGVRNHGWWSRTSQAGHQIAASRTRMDCAPVNFTICKRASLYRLRSFRAVCTWSGGPAVGGARKAPAS